MRYSENSQTIVYNGITMKVKAVQNSEFELLTDTTSTKKNKAVRTVEKYLREIQHILQSNFEKKIIVCQESKFL